MPSPDLTAEKRRLIEDLARDLVREIEDSECDDEWVCCGSCGEGAYVSPSIGRNAQSIIEKFLISQVGKGVL